MSGWVENEEDYIYSSSKALFCNIKGIVALSYW